MQPVTVLRAVAPLLGKLLLKSVQASTETINLLLEAAKHPEDIIMRTRHIIAFMRRLALEV
ncbi:hypothetical protein ABID21_003644 [Pseudorhizobium tarimense]|uniref:Uncharacterized protein n=1 Tax=Pseudorhizobium tarimense TaxID=1079109 RepID=A0ABV2HAF5_9HYPH